MRWTLPVVFALLVPLVAPALPAADVDALILEQLADAGRADVFVKMASAPDTVAAREIRDRDERLWFVRNERVAHAERTQRGVRALLDARGAAYQVFWINNSLLVRGADRELVDALAALDAVAYLRGDHQVPLVVPVEVREAPSTSPAGVEWNIDKVNAPAVWSAGWTGTGVVVANVDTGVRWTHDALVNTYRGGAGDHDYNWFDPDLVHFQPTDNNGHGTHTMGTMVGDDGGTNQIGVAPGATWIATQGCDGFFCSDSDLIGAAQFIACPTDVNGNNPDCSMAPHIVNNSWGGGAGDGWYLSYIDAYIDAGILPVFSAGNSGSSCSSIGSPGDYQKTISVANTTSSDGLSSSSSRGPSSFTGRPQPDISAPGTSVRSSYYLSDSSYASLTGTSMAAPHIVGAAALILSRKADATFAQIYQGMTGQACQATLQTPGGSTSCGGIAWNDFPSNHYGWGRLDIGATMGLNSPCD